MGHTIIALLVVCGTVLISTPTYVVGDDCSQVLTGTSGSIASPNYPNTVGYNNLDCNWYINVPAGQAIKLTFQSPFDLEPGREHLSIFGASPFTPNSELIGRKTYSGHVVPPVFTSISNRTGIEFYTQNGAGKGFNVTWEAVDSDFGQCGGNLTGTTGAVASPNYPSNYDDNINCSWVIDVPSGHFIKVKFHAFSLERNGDALKIYEDNSTEVLQERESYTGDSLPPVYMSYTDRVEMTLTTDDNNGTNVTRQGFYMTWETVDQRCGGVEDGLSGSIASLHYPHVYDHDNCTWVIEVTDGKFIRLKFANLFALDPYKSSLQISESEKTTSSYTGVFVPPVYTSHTNRVEINFIPGRSGLGLGFNMTWERVDVRCGQTVSGLSGSISSPNYPHYYNRDEECQWVINVPAGRSISLTFQEPFDMGAFGSLKIFEANQVDENHQFASYSGSSVPPAYTSTTNRVKITFTPGLNSFTKGFRLLWEAVENPRCGQILTVYSTSQDIPSVSARTLNIDTRCITDRVRCELTYTSILDEVQLCAAGIFSINCIQNFYRATITVKSSEKTMVINCDNNFQHQHICAPLGENLHVTYDGNMLCASGMKDNITKFLAVSQQLNYPDITDLPPDIPDPDIPDPDIPDPDIPDPDIPDPDPYVHYDFDDDDDDDDDDGSNSYWYSLTCIPGFAVLFMCFYYYRRRYHVPVYRVY